MPRATNRKFLPRRAARGGCGCNSINRRSLSARLERKISRGVLNAGNEFGRGARARTACRSTIRRVILLKPSRVAETVTIHDRTTRNPIGYELCEMYELVRSSKRFPIALRNLHPPRLSVPLVFFFFFPFSFRTFSKRV